MIFSFVKKIIASQSYHIMMVYHRIYGGRTCDKAKVMFYEEITKGAKKFMHMNYQKIKYMKEQLLNIIQKGDYYIPNLEMNNQEKMF